MAVLTPLLKLFEEDPELERTRFEVDPNIAAFYRAEAADLMGQRDADRITRDKALAEYERIMPGMDESFDADLEFLSDIRPEGRQEQRFSEMIRSMFDDIRKSNQTGLERGRANRKLQTALGGNSPFADSRYARAGDQILEANFEADMAARESEALLNNAQSFLASYKPGSSMQLGQQRMGFLNLPMMIRGQADALSQGRAASALKGLRGSYDDHYAWEQDKNWATWLNALGEVGQNALSVYSSLYGGGMMGGMGGGGGMGGMGGGGGGGGLNLNSGSFQGTRPVQNSSGGMMQFDAGQGFNTQQFGGYA